VSVWDGQTVIIGGLVREDVQTVEDKIPGLGDLPLIGRMFRSQVDQHIKRNLVMFVTAHLINPAGDLVHGDEEKEEDVAPLSPPDLAPPPSLPEVPMSK
jgi:general secretion pathway protein D